MAGVPLNKQLFDQYVTASRAMMADLSKIVGDSYDPGEDYDLTNAIHRAIAVSTTVMTMLNSLHAFHPPMVAPPQGMPPAPAPPGTPLQEQPPPASV